ncbi:hypothetical protein HDV63DRAFT_233118 [Trichoderma sp. SZMC 28014]
MAYGWSWTVAAASLSATLRPCTAQPECNGDDNNCQLCGSFQDSSHRPLLLFGGSKTSAFCAVGFLLWANGQSVVAAGVLFPIWEVQARIHVYFFQSVALFSANAKDRIVRVIGNAPTYVLRVTNHQYSCYR